jgi:hypothetical protein
LAASLRLTENQQIALSEMRLVSVMEQLFQVGEFMRGSKVTTCITRIIAI